MSVKTRTNSTRSCKNTRTMSVKVKTSNKMNILYRIYTMFYYFMGELILNDHTVIRTTNDNIINGNDNKSFYEAILITSTKKKDCKNHR